MKILCQKKASDGGQLVADNLGVKLIYPWELGVDTEMAINWGTTIGGPNLNSPSRVVYNEPHAVSAAVSKRATFEFAKAHGLPVLPFTTSKKVAKGWYDEGRTVYCRTLSAASAAKGLVLANKEAGKPLVKAPLYTRFCKSTFEVRVFCDSEGIMDGLVLVKRRLSPQNLPAAGLEKANYWIRNLANGWVFLLPEAKQEKWCKQLVPYARQYLEALGLHFGAVELLVVLDNGLKSFRLIEINTAPGLARPETIEWMTTYFGALKEENE